ncbi:hypothetical protein GCM10025857_21470 [Alicyclobacillus contaminans]|uniref:LrgB family protein n=1 Tax=Alicyclobacillus contaminans TaxID=392016 RepID=UPI0003F7BD45|nr:LrgB family protein [Alicyclobacillus contaminans]GMA50790.1 hypothetical protein GCM10025857_21470 [Alicyclobacillus contaminans]
MRPWINIGLTLAVYLICRWVYRRYPLPWLNPMLTSVALLMVLLLSTHTSYAAYIRGSDLLTLLLGPATVAFAVPLHRHFELLKRHAVELLCGIALGSLLAVVSSVSLARLLRLTPILMDSLAPRSVTTPIAMQVSAQLGGNAILTSVFVIATAFVGLVVGPLTIRWLKIQSALAKGMLMGMGAHGIGTSRAFEFGPLEGTFSSLSMILAAAFTVLLAPLVVPFLR